MTAALNDLADVSQTPAAIISTVGALLGVMLGGFLTAVLDSFRQRRQEERLAQAARRLLADEMAQIRDAFLRIADDGHVRRGGIPKPVASWDQYRELLACRLADRQWYMLAQAVLVACDLCAELEQLTAADVGVGQLPTALGMQLKQSADALGDASSRLSTF
jgi:hypothetical protein